MTCKKSGIYYIKGYQSNNNDQVKHLASVKEYMNACVIWTGISPEPIQIDKYESSDYTVFQNRKFHTSEAN